MIDQGRELKRLLKAGGFVLEAVVPTRALDSVIVARPAAAAAAAAA